MTSGFLQTSKKGKKKIEVIKWASEEQSSSTQTALIVSECLLTAKSQPGPQTLDSSIYPATRPQNLLHLLLCIMSWSFRYNQACGGRRRGRGKRWPCAWHKPSLKLHSLGGPAAAFLVIMEHSLKRPPVGQSGCSSSGLGSKGRRVHTCCWDEACCNIGIDWYKPWGGTLTRMRVFFCQCFQLSWGLKEGFNCNVTIFHFIYASTPSFSLQFYKGPSTTWLSSAFSRSLLTYPE